MQVVFQKESVFMFFPKDRNRKDILDQFLESEKNINFWNCPAEENAYFKKLFW